MRPKRLQVEGFASFREPVEIDFTGSDLFVLFGPTGAGKSSIIDAMTFALYGAVPRYDSQNLVWPVISQGLAEARVLLEFTVGNVDYTAVRVVRRTAGGASTKAATLEDASGRALASNPDELSEAIARLIGLPFEHFTRCVVLPQGAFADFMHAKPRDRQDLLVQLLGLDVYQQIAQAANQRAAAESNRIAVLAERLESELAGATDAALEAARDRVAALETLLATIESARPELDVLAAEQDRAVAAAQQADTRAALLDSVRMPAGSEKIAQESAAAADGLASAEVALNAALEARQATEQGREALPERSRIEATLEKHARRPNLEATVRTSEAALADAARASSRATAALEDVERRCAEVDERLQRLQRDHAAFHLAEQLAKGEPCPVCLQKVRSLPAHEAPADVDSTRSEREVADHAREGARAVAERAARTLAVRQTELDAQSRQLDGLIAELEAQPTAEQARTLLAEVEAADARLREARAAENAARERLDRARDAAASKQAAQDRARREFDHARDTLAAQGLAPPAAQREALGADWRALVIWAQERAPAERGEAAAARETAGRASAARAARIDEQRALCGQHQVDASRREPRDACADALAAARADAGRLERDVATATELRAEHARREREARVAKELGRLLNARNFEGWLMHRALHQLVAGATRVLRQLSGEAYSLALDARNEFLVIDHRNANERRIARTLSGGETFLASLALALALAEHVADLSAGGAARLDALFLDEGFGTLDADTLDTVAAAIDELGSRGRMVGIVTHVRELAERIPVRFEVQKVGGVSSVEKVVT